MMEEQKSTPTAAELEILTVLWEQQPLTVKEVHDKLSGTKEIGYTTALKIMQNMTAKGLLAREPNGKNHLYYPCYKKEETRGRLLDLVAVRHPDLHRLARVQPGGQRHVGRLVKDLDLCAPVLTLPARHDLAAEQTRHQLQAITNAEQRHAEPEQPFVDRRRAPLVTRRRPARQDDRARLQLDDLRDRHVERVDLRVDAELAHAARD